MAVSGGFCYSESVKNKHESTVTRATFEAHKKTVNVVYLLTCSTTEKQYVGQSSQWLWKRWREHRNAALGEPKQTYRQHTILAKAMRKYGPVAFDLTVLEICTCSSHLDEAEARWIRTLGTLSPGGYNLAAGGKAAPRAPEVGARNCRRKRASAFQRFSADASKAPNPMPSEAPR